MKKKIFLHLFAFLCVILILNGCSKKTDTEKTPEQSTPTSTSTKEIESKEETVSETPLSDEPRTVLDSYSLDIDGDGTEEKIELLTSAERGSDGIILWDDGQEWKLTVKKKDSEFVLFHGRIQIGMLNHQIYEVDERLHIAYTLNATAQLAFVHYEFDPDNNVFVKKDEYVTSEGNINVLHHTMNTFDK